MDNIIDLIKSRRSVRSYLDKPLSKETTDTLIELARWAPSGMNEQPWGFIVIKDKSLIKEVSDRAIPYINKAMEQNRTLAARYKRRMSVKDFSIFYHAPCLIVVIGRKDAFSFEVDCAMAAQNLMLAAWSMGIASCWVGMMGVLEKDAWFRKRFEMPDNYSIVAPIALGYTDKKNLPAIERKNIGFFKEL